MRDESIESYCRVRKFGAELDALVPSNVKAEELAGGFGFTEGPVWLRSGFLLFSDIPNNVIFKWDPKSGISEFLASSGSDGSNAAPGSHVGSNGLTLDREGRLIICEHGNRRVTRLEKNGRRTVLADRYQDKRLNSPNDVVCKSDGTIYFTDPPYGLPQRDADPLKELHFNGVYRLVEGQVQLLYDGLTRPNGLAFSLGEKYLYVSNSDRSRMIWMRFDVVPDGRLSNPEVFYDATPEPAEGLPDGLKLDRLGNLYCTGPGGILIFSADGKHLGTIEFPEVPANCNWGDDGRTLYVTARTSLYRIRLLIEGIRP
jgi:gluconolactonase